MEPIEPDEHLLSEVLSQFAVVRIGPQKLCDLIPEFLNPWRDPVGRGVAIRAHAVAPGLRRPGMPRHGHVEDVDRGYRTALNGDQGVSVNPVNGGGVLKDIHQAGMGR